MRWLICLGIVGLLLLGCDGPKPPAEPLPFTGPNQVVLHVPNMVCPTCPDKVTQILGTVSWIEPTSIVADRSRRQVRFTLRDPAQYDLQRLVTLLDERGFGESVQELATNR